mgnify:CR=1 FL=1|tara:strand:+ start:2735 stop:3307 length:573 start_codon:yes stop_codon:yes gene_type:complete
MKNKILLLSAAMVLAVSSQSFASKHIEGDEKEPSTALVFVAKPSSFADQRDELVSVGSGMEESLRKAGLLEEFGAQLKEVQTRLATIQKAHDKLNGKLEDARKEAATQTGKDDYRNNDIIAFLEQARADVTTKAFEGHMVAKDGNKDRLYAIRQIISGSSDDIYAFNEQFEWARGLLKEIQDKIIKILVS